MLVLTISAVMAGVLPGPVQAGWLTDTWPGSTAAPGSEADQLLELARAQVGKPYRYAAIGPDAFDCSGLIWYLFNTTGLADRMGGKRRGATKYLNWFKQYGEWSPNLADAEPGDILIWGGGKHAGIYISGNWAVSALNGRYDVRIHRADPMGLPFTAVLKVPMSRSSDGSYTAPNPEVPPPPAPQADPAGAPMPPTTLNATAQANLEVALSWTGAGGALTPLKYRVYRNGAYYVTSKNEYLLDHPWLPGRYTYQVQTVDASGARSFRSAEVTVDVYGDGTPTDVVDATPPTAPVGLIAQSLGNKQVALTWEPSTDTGPTGVGYFVKRGAKIIARVWTPYFVDRPPKAKTFSYSVVAFDGYGNSVTSASVQGLAAW